MGAEVYREALLGILGGKCVICKSTERLEIDHIIPLAEGGKSETANLQLLCPEHHREKHQRKALAEFRPGPYSGLGRPRILKVGDHLPKKWLTPEETESIIRVAESHNRREAVALRLYSYGLRRSEVVGSPALPGIRRRDVNTLKGTIWVRGKGDPSQIVKDRELSFPDDVMRMMSTLILETPLPDDRVFPIDEVTIWRHLKQYAQEAGIQDWQKVHPHRLRAFFASDAKWRRGLDVADVQGLMRHKSIAQTITYTGPMPPDYAAQKMRQIAQQRAEEREQ